MALRDNIKIQNNLESISEHVIVINDSNVHRVLSYNLSVDI